MVNYRHPNDNWIMDDCCDLLTLSYTDIYNLMDSHNWIIEIHTWIMDIDNLDIFPAKNN